MFNSRAGKLIVVDVYNDEDNMKHTTISKKTDVSKHENVHFEFPTNKIFFFSDENETFDEEDNQKFVPLPTLVKPGGCKGFVTVVNANDNIFTALGGESEVSRGSTEFTKDSHNTGNFVSVLQVNSDDNEKYKHDCNIEEVTIYRLPDEKLGMALKFEGGVDVTKNVSKVYIQSLGEGTPAARAVCTIKPLQAGDEILMIQGRGVSELTRFDCITILREATNSVKLMVNHHFPNEVNHKEKNTTPLMQNLDNNKINSKHIKPEKERNKGFVPPIPPRKVNKCSRVFRFVQNKQDCNEENSDKQVILADRPREDLCRSFQNMNNQASELFDIDNSVNPRQFTKNKHQIDENITVSDDIAGKWIFDKHTKINKSETLCSTSKKTCGESTGNSIRENDEKKIHQNFNLQQVLFPFEKLERELDEDNLSETSELSHDFLKYDFMCKKDLEITENSPIDPPVSFQDKVRTGHEESKVSLQSSVVLTGSPQILETFNVSYEEKSQPRKNELYDLNETLSECNKKKDGHNIYKGQNKLFQLTSFTTREITDQNICINVTQNGNSIACMPKSHYDQEIPNCTGQSNVIQMSDNLETKNRETKEIKELNSEEKIFTKSPVFPRRIKMPLTLESSNVIKDKISGDTKSFFEVVRKSFPFAFQHKIVFSPNELESKDFPAVSKSSGQWCTNSLKTENDKCDLLSKIRISEKVEMYQNSTDVIQMLKRKDGSISEMKYSSNKSKKVEYQNVDVANQDSVVSKKSARFQQSFSTTMVSAAHSKRYSSEDLDSFADTLNKNTQCRSDKMARNFLTPSIEESSTVNSTYVSDGFRGFENYPSEHHACVSTSDTGLTKDSWRSISSEISQLSNGNNFDRLEVERPDINSQNALHKSESIKSFHMTLQDEAEVKKHNTIPNDFSTKMINYPIVKHNILAESPCVSFEVDAHVTLDKTQNINIYNENHECMSDSQTPNSQFDNLESPGKSRTANFHVGKHESPDKSQITNVYCDHQEPLKNSHFDIQKSLDETQATNFHVKNHESLEKIQTSSFHVDTQESLDKTQIISSHIVKEESSNKLQIINVYFDKENSLENFNVDIQESLEETQATNSHADIRESLEKIKGMNSHVDIQESLEETQVTNFHVDIQKYLEETQATNVHVDIQEFLEETQATNSHFDKHEPPEKSQVTDFYDNNQESLDKPQTANNHTDVHNILDQSNVIKENISNLDDVDNSYVNGVKVNKLSDFDEAHVKNIQDDDELDFSGIAHVYNAQNDILDSLEKPCAENILDVLEEHQVLKLQRDKDNNLNQIYVENILVDKLGTFDKSCIKTLQVDQLDTLENLYAKNINKSERVFSTQSCVNDVIAENLENTNKPDVGNSNVEKLDTLNESNVKNMNVHRKNILNEVQNFQNGKQNILGKSYVTRGNVNSLDFDKLYFKNMKKSDVFNSSSNKQDCLAKAAVKNIDFDNTGAINLSCEKNVNFDNMNVLDELQVLKFSVDKLDNWHKAHAKNVRVDKLDVIKNQENFNFDVTKSISSEEDIFINTELVLEEPRNENSFADTYLSLGQLQTENFQTISNEASNKLCIENPFFVTNDGLDTLYEKTSNMAVKNDLNKAYININGRTDKYHFERSRDGRDDYLDETKVGENHIAVGVASGELLDKKIVQDKQYDMIKDDFKTVPSKIMTEKYEISNEQNFRKFHVDTQVILDYTCNGRSRINTAKRINSSDRMSLHTDENYKSKNYHYFTEEKSKFNVQNKNEQSVTRSEDISIYQQYFEGQCKKMASFGPGDQSGNHYENNYFDSSSQNTKQFNSLVRSPLLQVNNRKQKQETFTINEAEVENIKKWETIQNKIYGRKKQENVIVKEFQPSRALKHKEETTMNKAGIAEPFVRKCEIASFGTTSRCSDTLEPSPQAINGEEFPSNNIDAHYHQYFVRLRHSSGSEDSGVFLDDVNGEAEHIAETNVHTDGVYFNSHLENSEKFPTSELFNPADKIVSSATNNGDLINDPLGKNSMKNVSSSNGFTFASPILNESVDNNLVSENVEPPPLPASLPPKLEDVHSEDGKSLLGFSTFEKNLVLDSEKINVCGNPLSEICNDQLNCVSCLSNNKQHKDIDADADVVDQEQTSSSEASPVLEPTLHEGWSKEIHGNKPKEERCLNENKIANSEMEELCSENKEVFSSDDNQSVLSDDKYQFKAKLLAEQEINVNSGIRPFHRGKFSNETVNFTVETITNTDYNIFSDSVVDNQTNNYTKMKGVIISDESNNTASVSNLRPTFTSCTTNSLPKLDSGKSFSGLQQKKYTSPFTRRGYYFNRNVAGRDVNIPPILSELPWKCSDSDIPKYSPAFKCRSLQTFGVAPISSISSNMCTAPLPVMYSSLSKLSSISSTDGSDVSHAEEKKINKTVLPDKMSLLYSKLLPIHISNKTKILTDHQEESVQENKEEIITRKMYGSSEDITSVPGVSSPLIIVNVSPTPKEIKYEQEYKLEEIENKFKQCCDYEEKKTEEDTVKYSYLYDCSEEFTAVKISDIRHESNKEKTPITRKSKTEVTLNTLPGTSSQNVDKKISQDSSSLLDFLSNIEGKFLAQPVCVNMTVSRGEVNEHDQMLADNDSEQQTEVSKTVPKCHVTRNERSPIILLDNVNSSPSSSLNPQLTRLERFENETDETLFKPSILSQQKTVLKKIENDLTDSVKNFRALAEKWEKKTQENKQEVKLSLVSSSTRSLSKIEHLPNAVHKENAKLPPSLIPKSREHQSYTRRQSVPSNTVGTNSSSMVKLREKRLTGPRPTSLIEAKEKVHIDNMWNNNFSYGSYFQRYNNVSSEESLPKSYRNYDTNEAFTKSRKSLDQLGQRNKPRASTSVSDIRKNFQNQAKSAQHSWILKPGSRRTSEDGNFFASYKCSLSSISTDSDTGGTGTNTPLHYGSQTSLSSSAYDRYDSVTSVASTTSLISLQELQQLINEANQSLQDEVVPSVQDVTVVVIHREIQGGSIGITLAGGVDCEVKEITVHKVITGSLADRDGRIKKGDRIISINGRCVKGMSHSDAVNLLKSRRKEVVLVVSRERPDYRLARVLSIEKDVLYKEKNVSYAVGAKGMDEVKKLNSEVKSEDEYVKKVEILKDGTGLGFSLEGGKDSPAGDKPLIVKKVFTGGAAAKEGTLKAGDEILAINDKMVVNMTRTEAWNFMKKLTDGPVLITLRETR